MLRHIMVVGLALFLIACSSRVTDFTVISTKNIDLSRFSEYERADARVTGEDAKHIVIFIPTGIPDAKAAIDAALDSIPGAVALLDGVLEREWFYIPLLFGQEKFVVTGTALIDPELVDRQANNEGSEFIFIDEKGQVADHQELTDEQYEQLIELGYTNPESPTQ